MDLAESLPASVEQLVARYPYDVRHTRQVARLALRLFAELQAIHGYDWNISLLLHCAARLHDIGWVEGQQGHHKTSQRLILEAELPPFTPREKTLVALIARYHRKAWPSSKHDRYAQLSPEDRGLVRMLAAILRVADGLDRTHAVLIRNLRCTLTPAEILIILDAADPAEAEQAAALAKGDLLEDVLGRRLIMEQAK